MQTVVYTFGLLFFVAGTAFPATDHFVRIGAPPQEEDVTKVKSKDQALLLTMELHRWKTQLENVAVDYEKQSKTLFVEGERRQMTEYLEAVRDELSELPKRMKILRRRFGAMKPVVEREPSLQTLTPAELAAKSMHFEAKYRSAIEGFKEAKKKTPERAKYKEKVERAVSNLRRVGNEAFWRAAP